MAFSKRPKWIDNLDMFDINSTVLDWMGRADDHMDYLTADRDRLRDTLKELTTAAENECRHDTVLRKALSPYCEAARLALEAKDD